VQQKKVAKRKVEHIARIQNEKNRENETGYVSECVSEVVHETGYVSECVSVK
jgi:hypothetical protein